MKLEEILDNYYDKMTQIQLYQRAIQELARKKLEEIEKFEQYLEDKPKLKDHSHSSHSMHFRRAKDGNHIFFGKRKLSIKDRRLSVILHQNKQYQWLLSEAYEEFEDCLERLYAHAGYTNNNFWPKKDFKDLSLEDLSKQSFEWFEERAANKKNAPSSIINKFRNTFCSIKKIEVDNALEINLYLAITLVQFLRHIIVHRGGIVRNKEKFKERVLTQCGLFNSGNPLKKYEDFIDHFFGTGEYKNTIILLELPANTEINSYINVFNILSGYLMAYINIIHEHLDFTYHKSA